MLLRVSEVMHTGDDNPTISPAATVMDAILMMSTAPVRGVVTIIDEAGMLIGLFTDGDFRQLMRQVADHNQIMAGPISEVMTRKPTVTKPDVLAAEALRIMEEREFDNLPVVDETGRAVGMVDIQDLMKLRVI